MPRIQIEELDKAVAEILKEYGDDVSEALKETYTELGKKTAKIVKEAAPENTGAYKRRITATEEKGTIGERAIWVHVKAPDYRIAHLLEHGHYTSGGTAFVAPRRHWINGENYVKSHYEEKLKEKIGGIK